MRRKAIGILLSSLIASIVQHDIYAQSPTYSEHIAPILQAHCTDCHRPNQIAPMSLLTFQEVRPWAKSIRKQVSEREMPPFHASGPIGRYRNDPRLTDDVIETIVSWVDAGSPQGNPSLLPPPQTWESERWHLGEPDLIIDFPPFTILGNGTDQESLLSVLGKFPEDIWIRGMDFRGSDDQTVHHAAIFGNNLGVLQVKLKDLMMTWAPGLLPQFYPPGEATLIRRGSTLVLMGHYAPRDTDKVEVSQVGLYFADGPIRKTNGAVHFLIANIDIPPHDPNYRLVASSTVHEDIFITHFWAHMHLRGKSARYILHYPDGRSEVALDIPTYSFHWQRYYYLAEPIPVPKGTRIDAEAVWDNSANNPANPDPGQRVGAGNRTDAEMGGGTVYYFEQKEREAPIFVKAGRVQAAASL